jgi:invasion protein IalB
VLTRVTFVLSGPAQPPELQVQVPLGVYLPAGAAVQVDENPPQSLRFKACDRSGCYAQTSLSADFFAQLRKGKQFVLTFKNASKKTITVPLSLDQLDESYETAQNA